jgi:hypothetical protein
LVFPYYDRLSARRQRIYRASDAIKRIEIPDVAALQPLARAIEPALALERREAVEKACQALVDALNAQLATPRVRVVVLARRPNNDAYELQGLYEPMVEERADAINDLTGGVARITVWMRTAQKQQVVKFRTFLRTLLHEVCHHLDYELYKLAETFHTEGFYARESALVRELLNLPGAAAGYAPP